MTELTKTAVFCATACVLVLAAVVVDPGSVTPEVFSDQGEFFYPEFKDPQAPKVIEVVDYDEATATARPLKVEFKNNKWSIPSHYGYPADAQTRLASTAAALMELRKDKVVSDRVEDHASCGVVDPFDQGAGLVGRGKRVTLRDGKGAVLADFIVGKEVEEGRGSDRYLRIPGQRRVYAVKTNADVSARFEDWIETDLLKLSSSEIRKVTINKYSINEMEGKLEGVERMTLTRDKDGKWSMSGGGKLNDSKTMDLALALTGLRIVDVQPKPDNLTQDLKTDQGIRVSAESIVSLRQKGFFIIPPGQLLSNAGEIGVESAKGVQYTLRFGEVASGSAAASAGGGSGSKESGSSASERRYLFITVGYNEALAKQYAEPGKEPDKKGSDLARELQNRFADWYYVISGADFNKLRPSRRDLTAGVAPASAAPPKPSASLPGI